MVTRIPLTDLRARMPRAAALICLCGVATLNASSASAQSFPSKPIRIVTNNAGGSTDNAARLIAPAMSLSLGQPVVIDNRPTGVVPIEVVAKSLADGYTLLCAGTILWIAPFLQKVPYDPVKDFAPIILTNWQPNVLVVHPSLPVKSVRELIALAKARPGQLNYASGSFGSSPHLATELFKKMAGVNIVRVPYKGSAQAATGLVSGEVQVGIDSAPPLLPQLRSGRLRALAVTSAQPTALVPGIPTLAASGVPGYEAVSITAMFAPAGTPASTIKLFNSEVTRVLRTPEMKEKFFSSGAEVGSSSPEELAATIRSDMEKWGKLIKEAGVTAH